MNTNVVFAFCFMAMLLVGPTLLYFYKVYKRRQLSRRIRSFNEHKVFVTYGVPFGKSYIICKDTITAFEIEKKLKKDGEWFVKVEQPYYIHGCSNETIGTNNKKV